MKNLFLTGLMSVFGFLTMAQVSELNQTQYLGRWYQVYSDLFVDATFENSSYCDTADYGLYPNNTISVWNRERQYSVTGPEREIFGWASIDNSSKPGELTVHLQTTEFPAPYWVFQLGPVIQEKYEYSIVSDPFKLTLFVLARNVSRFMKFYNTNVSQYLKEQGFTNFLNTPIVTIQDNCVYWKDN
jgi:apolipoprotein D and lipocalin family protein